MNTHAGYSKRTLADTNVLLTGGGDKSLADFLGGIQYVSASNKVLIKTAANNASWTDLILPYLPLSGGTITGTLTVEDKFYANKGINVENRSYFYGGVEFHDPLYIYNTLYVNDNSLFGGSATFNNVTHHNSRGYFYSGIDVSGAHANFDDGIDVREISHFYGGVHFYQSININHKAHIYDYIDYPINNSNNKIINTILYTATDNDYVRRMSFATFGAQLRDSGYLDDRYVSSLTTSGNYLRWIKGGNNNDITIPYAIYAGYAPQLSQTSISSLSSFTHSTNLIYTAASGSNSVSDKPSGVDAFGVISYKTASGWYGQLLTGINSGGTSSNLYWRTASTLSGGWKKILDSNNSSVSKSGETLTVKINDVSQSLTNTWRDITDSYLETNTEISLSLKGGNDLYNELANGPANYLNCYKEMTVSPGAITAWTWYNTGVAGPTLGSGIYILKISINTSGPFWRCNFIGLLYWFSGGTNASEADEVIMHSAGHSNNNNVHIYIRTVKRENSTLSMLMTSNINLSAYNYTFRFFKIGD